MRPRQSMRDKGVDVARWGLTWWVGLDVLVECEKLFLFIFYFLFLIGIIRIVI